MQRRNDYDRPDNFVTTSIRFDSGPGSQRGEGVHHGPTSHDEDDILVHKGLPHQSDVGYSPRNRTGSVCPSATFIAQSGRPVAGSGPSWGGECWAEAPMIRCIIARDILPGTTEVKAKIDATGTGGECRMGNPNVTRDAARNGRECRSSREKSQ
jgi:hypothetical protein